MTCETFAWLFEWQKDYKEFNHLGFYLFTVSVNITNN